MLGEMPTLREKAVDTVKTAFRTIPDAPYVSYSENSKPEAQSQKQERIRQEKELKKQGKKIDPLKKPESPPPLTTSNHSFYIGKIFRQDNGVKAKISRALGWAPDEKIYSEDFIEASLKYLLKYRAPGEKIRIVVCRKLSEILNGPEDTANTLTNEEEIALIKKIARDKFGLTEDDLLILPVEEDVSHLRLLDALKEGTNEITQEFEPEKVFSFSEDELDGDCPSEVNDSYDIARILYLAMKENPSFAARIQRGVPSLLKKYDADDKDLPKSYYTLSEVAIRIYDIIKGKTIHAGAARQSVYDEVIVAILKGSEGPFASTPALLPLFERLENKKFGTIHVDNRENPFRQNLVRGRARRRLATVTAILASTVLSSVSTPVAVMRYQQHREQQVAAEAVQKYVESQVKGLTWRTDNMNLDVTPKMVESYADTMLEDIQYRYGVKPEILEDLNIRTLLKQSLVENNSIPHVASNQAKYSKHVDEFVEANRLLFRSKGITIDKPYAHMLAHIDLFVNAAEKPLYPPLKYESDHESNKQCTNIGVYVSHFLPGHKYEVSILEEDGEKVLVARNYYNEKELSRFPMIEEHTMDTKTARTMAREFIRDMKYYDAKDLHKWHEQMIYLTEPNTFSGIPGDFEQASDADFYHLLEAETYVDTFGLFEYQVIKGYCNFGEKKDGYCVKARIPGEDQFTIARGREVAYRYKEAKEGDLYRGWPD